MAKNLIRDKDVWIDHTVVGPFSPTFVRGSSTHHSHVLASKETLKNNERSGALKAAMDSGALYYPFAVTTLGGIGLPGMRVEGDCLQIGPES